MKRILLLSLIPIFGFGFQSLAQGDLIVSPARLVFDNKKQTQELNLVNIGKDTAVYTISFVQKNMKEDGSFVNIEKPDEGQMFADPYMRIFPRTIKLAPGKPQVIKLQYTRKSDMADGEYRSHLYFRAEKNGTPLGMADMKIDTTKLVVQLIPVFGISIPIIINSGSVVVASTLSDVKISNEQKDLQTLKFTINRTGNMSIYGDLSVEFAPKKGKPFPVGTMNGVGVYTNIDKRNITINLTNDLDKKLKNGKLKVKYMSSNEKKPVLLAKAEIDVD
jgi:hypothetical protein